MQRRIESLLAEAGLSETEIRLYVLLLKHGKGNVARLAKEARINLMTAYRTMQRLEDRGLIERSRVNRKESSFAPLSLEKLTDKLVHDQLRLRRLQLALQGTDRLLPYLNNTPLQASKAEPIEIREGIDAFREEYLKFPHACRGEYLCIGNMDSYWDVAGMGDQAPEEMSFRAQRYRRNIFARVINKHSPTMSEIHKRDTRELRTLKLTDSIPLDRDYVGFSEDYLCHFICDKENPRTIVIRHPELVAAHKNHFNSLWAAGV